MAMKSLLGFASVSLALMSAVAGNEKVPLASGGPPDYRQRWAIIVGINDYSAGQGLSNLPYAANDAREFRDLLVKEFGYDDDHVLYLTDDANEANRTYLSDQNRIKSIVDGSPNLDDLRNAFDTWLAGEDVRADDSVLFFFAGHGLRDRGTGAGFLAAANSRKQDRENTCISVEWLHNRLKNKNVARCRHKLVLLDCCFSGTLFNSAGSNLFNQRLVARPVPAPLREGLAAEGVHGANYDVSPRRFSGELGYYLAGSAFVGMSAGLGTQPVTVGSAADEHSLFTRELLRAMGERANSSREDHVFTFTELAAVVRPQVAARAQSRDVFSEQIPLAGRLDPGAGEFVFRQTVDVEVPWEAAQRVAGENDSRRLAVRSGRAIEGSMSLANLLAAEALRRGITREAHGRLFRNLQGRSEITCYLHSSSGGVESVAFRSDGQVLAASETDRIVLWDVGRKKQIRELPKLEDGSVIRDLSFSPDGRLAVAYHTYVSQSDGELTTKGGVVLYGLDATPIFEDKFEGGASCIAFSPDGRFLAAGCETGVAVWDLTLAKPIQRQPLVVSEGSIRCVAFRADSQLLAAGYDNTFGQCGVFLWNARNWEREESQPGSVVGKARCMAFTPDGQVLAVGRDASIVLWDVATKKELPVSPLQVTEGTVQSVSFDRSGAMAAAALNTHKQISNVVIWNAETWQREQDGPLVVSEGDVQCVSFSPQIESLAVAYAGGVMLWNIEQKSRLRRSLFDLAGGEIFALAFSSKQRILAAALRQKVLVWDIDRRRRFALRIPGAQVEGVALDRHGSVLAAMIQVDDISGVVLWEVNNRRLLTDQPLQVREGKIQTIAFGPEGQLLAAGFSSRSRIDLSKNNPQFGSGGAVLWDMATRNRLTSKPLVVPKGNVHSIAFSEDAGTLGVGFETFDGSGGVLLWDVGRFEQIDPSPLRVPEMKVDKIAFSPKSEILVAKCQGHRSRFVFWNAKSGRRLQLNLDRGSEPRSAQDLAFSSDGETLALAFSLDNVGSPDRTGIVLWDAARGVPRQDEVLPVNGTVEFMAFDADGSKLFVVTNNELFCWNTDLEQWVRIAGEIANRNLTWAEWRKHIWDSTRKPPYHRTIRSFPWPPDLPGDERLRAESLELLDHRGVSKP